MTVFSEGIIYVAHQFFPRAAPEQGGLLSGKDPSAVNLTDPLRLWIIQLGIIMVTTQVLSLLLRKMHQPRVIAEVLGGILLGPTAFGRIPGFTHHVFPSQSIPFLSLTANIGLVLFLFIVGLEIESSVVKRNVKMSACISFAGMVLPFGLGAGLSTVIYKQFVDTTTKFTHFMLFVGVAFSITAFPVLCRILTELKLLDTTVGIIVLSAGVGNDLVGWTLLALSVALVNAASGLTALWVLLTCVGWTLFLLFVVKRAVRWLAINTGSIENGQPTMFFMTCVMILVFGSAFFTDIIGVHAIFGGFLAGLTVPRDKGLSIALVEKLEDIVSIIFLPLYFTLSGLSTNLGLLNTATIWGYTIAICVLAYIGKFGGCTIAARMTGFGWREAASIGTLMSCKGLVELIVLNVGLTAGILDTRVFSMFVLEALFLTFMTTPVVVFIYPPKYRTRAVPAGQNFGSVQDDDREKDRGSQETTSVERDGWKTRLTVVLDKMEHLPGIMTVAQLFRPLTLDGGLVAGAGGNDAERRSPSFDRFSRTSPIVDALRLIELSDRTSGVMKSSVADSLLRTDPMLNAFKTFSDLNDVPATASLSVVPFDGLAAKVVEHARENISQLILVPWLPHTVPMTHTPGIHGAGGEPHTHAPLSPSTPTAAGATSTNPFDALFNFGVEEHSSPSVRHAHFVRSIFSQSTVDVALFVDRGRVGHASRQHIIMPFFGGPDDRVAISLVVQLCANRMTTAKIYRVKRRDAPPADVLTKPQEAHTIDNPKKEDALAPPTHDTGPTTIPAQAFPDTIYDNATTQARLQSETADNIMWHMYTTAAAISLLSPNTRGALSNVEFVEIEAASPLREMIQYASTEVDVATQRKTRPFVVTGRARRLAVESRSAELGEILEEHGHVLTEVRKTMGDVATAFLASSITAGVVVVHAANAER